MSVPTPEVDPKSGSKPRRLMQRMRWWLAAARADVRQYFRSHVSFTVALPVMLLLSVVVFTRSIFTNYIFDEQEALLANPYVNGTGLHFWQVLERDFWGLPPTRTIGSYRPLPNLIWRGLWNLKEHAWPPHFFNVLIHGVNGALVASLGQRWFDSRIIAWFCGTAFVVSAVVTEAVCGVVGIADVLSGLFTLLILWGLRLHWAWQLPCAFGFAFLGLLSKESTLTALPLVTWAALVMAPIDHPHRPRRWLRALLVGLGALGALVAYTYLRRYFFPVSLPPELQTPLPESEPLVRRLFHDFLRWFGQPRLPADPINNPLVEASTTERVAGALRVYFRGLVQVVFPWQLSGDYSFPQEPIPKRIYTLQSVLGGLLLVLPPIAGTMLWLRTLWLRRTRELTERLRVLSVFAVGLLWVPLTYFPHSNIPLVLPTVRAERFWYLPVIATALLIGFGLGKLWQVLRHRGRVRSATAVVICFFGFQAIRARAHALDYQNDLVFWRETAEAVPNSAKAHLNYGVMLGARGRLEERLEENRRALDLAPQWPMANIYYADTLCRLKRSDEAWPHYKRGFELGPNEQGLIALALQCLWDDGQIEKHEDELRRLAAAHQGSWLAYLATDIVDNGEKHDGVDPKYRPRGYNQGPRSEKTGSEDDKSRDDAGTSPRGTAS